jgi:hypothetical protein
MGRRPVVFADEFKERVKRIYRDCVVAKLPQGGVPDDQQAMECVRATTASVNRRSPAPVTEADVIDIVDPLPQVRRA